MDPNETWRLLREACTKMDWPAVVEFATALMEWIDKGGFPPHMDDPAEGDLEISKQAVYSACQFSIEWANHCLATHGGDIETGFGLTCGKCKADGPDSYAAAVNEGWIDLDYDPRAASGRFLGMCPSCRPSEAGDS